jgi:hypothetical protein
VTQKGKVGHKVCFREKGSKRAAEKAVLAVKNRQKAKTGNRWKV